MRAKTESDDRVRAEPVRKLVSDHQFEVPQSWLEKQTDQRLQSILRDMMQRGIDPRSQQVNWEGAREELKVQALEDARDATDGSHRRSRESECVRGRY